MNWLIGRITDINDSEYNALYTMLSTSRKAHIDSMKNSDARKRSLMANYLLNKLLQNYGENQICIENDENGKPYLKDCNLHISISHSGEFVACAVSQEPVGVDIEKIRPVSRRLIDYVCNESEREYVLNKETVNRFFEVWTTKEAYFKKDKSNFKSLRQVDTVTVKKQNFVIDGYCVTIV